MQRLSGKATLITGAGAGIGEAIAHKFAREGAHVLLNGLPGDPVEDVAAAVRDRYPEVTVATYLGDVAEPEHAEACVQAALDAFGTLDVLVNNAGVMPAVGETQDYPVEGFETLLHNNIRSAFLMTRAALPHLQKTRGNIVSAGSEAGYNGTPSFTPYGGTKAFLHAFMKGVAVEQAKYGVRANCVCPGPVDTAWTHTDEGGPMTDEMTEMLVKATPMARRGTTEEMANVYAFLASDEASYVTGTLVLVDGGITVAHGNIGEKTPDDVAQQPSGVLALEHSQEGYATEKPSGNGRA
ncbi:MAG: SDR family oxidoreductase [Rubricoccaceae bacterium]|nr:SDR family oxidoreductase [Rubricoccaceae bacterium]